MKAFRKPMRAILGAGALLCAAAVCAPAGAWPAQEPRTGGGKSAKHEVYGTIRSIKGMRLTVQTRSGSMVEVDAAPAREAHRSVALALDQAIDAVGTSDKAGVLHAETIQHAKPSSAMWPPDR